MENGLVEIKKALFDPSCVVITAPCITNCVESLKSEIVRPLVNIVSNEHADRKMVSPAKNEFVVVVVVVRLALLTGAE